MRIPLIGLVTHTFKNRGVKEYYLAQWKQVLKLVFLNYNMIEHGSETQPHRK